MASSAGAGASEPAPSYLTVAESRIDELRRRVAQDPGSRLFAQLAEEHRKAGEHGEAVRVARAGLAFHPVYPAARLTLGRALLELGDARSARGELEEAVRQAPENILAGRFLAQALEAAGDLGGALRQYELTLRLTPGDRDLEARFGALQRRLAGPTAGRRGGSADATAPGRRVDERQPGAGARAAEATPFASPTLAELYLRQGLAERAIEVYRQVVVENPGNEQARSRLTELERQARERAEQAEGKRRKLERTIDCLEALLGAARRR